MSMEDVAQEIELQEWKRNNTPRAEKTRFKPDEVGYGPEYCAIEICGADMPSERREWGFSVCVACATIREAQSRHRGR